MGRGYLAGTAWGALVGGLVVALASQVTDRRDLSAPAGVEADVPQVAGEAPGTPLAEAAPPAPVVAPEPEPEPETAAPASTEAPAIVAEALPPEAGTASPALAPSAAPAADAGVVAAPGVSALRETPAPPAEPAPALADAPPQVAAPEPTPLAEPAPPAAPPVALSQPDAAGSGAPVRAPADPALAAEAPRPLAPGPAAAPPVVATDATAPPPSVPAPVEVRPPATEADAPPSEVAVASPQEPPGAAAPAVLPALGDGPDAPAVTGTEAPEAIAEAPPAPGFQSAERVRVNRLPTIGGDAAEPMPEAPAAEVAEAPEAAAPRPGFQNAAGVRVNRLPTIGAQAAGDAPGTPNAAAPATALARNAVPFDNPDGAPLLTVILLHDGVTAPGAETGLDLPVPVSFAVDAGAEGARDAAAAYRAAGREVLLIPTIPQGAAPSDVEVALGVNLDTVPEAVALMDAPEGGFRAERAAVAQIVAAAADTGHGLVTYPRGMNTALQLAEREGIPVGSVFRALEPGDTEAALRSLDQAAFRARQEGGVILVGQAEPATVAALRRWVEINPNRQVAFAPVSAALAAGE